jgi:hypothetical protein
MGRLKMLQEYTEPMQIWIATAATGISQRLKGVAGEDRAVAALRASSDGILASVSR